MDFTVMSFNLRFNNPRDGENAWVYRKDEAATVIRELSPVVLGVQEATYPMLQDLEERLPQFEWVGVGREGGLAGEFSAVFYQPRLLQPVWAGHFWLSEEPDAPGTRYPGAACTRMCSWVQLRRRGGQEEFLFYNTHLDHVSEEARVHGSNLIRNHFLHRQSTTQLPTIAVGDMNAGPASAALHALRFLPDGKECLRDASDLVPGGDAQCTFHGFHGGIEGQPIDYILYNQGCEVSSYRVFREKINNRYPSDHYPILATVTLPS